MAKALATIWVFGDQLNRKIGALATAKPETHRILIIESAGKISSRRWHVQRAHFLITSMRRFALELEQAGFNQIEMLYDSQGMFPTVIAKR